MTPVLLLLLAGADDGATLNKFRDHVAAQMRSLPNYTCLQETVRTVRLPKEKKFERIDTVRMEVVLAEDKELFAWPGESNFSDAEIHDLVRNGAIGSGLFGVFTKQLFQSTVAAFQPVGPAEYTFRVPRFLSGYTIIGGGGPSVSGYEGRITADPATLELIAMRLSATDIPPNLHYTSIAYTVEYGRTAGVGVIPQKAVSVVKHISGEEYRNESTFRNCREFRGESTLLVEDVSSTVTADEPAAPPTPARPTAANAPTPHVKSAEPLPAGLQIEVKLQTTLDHKTTAVGDTFAAAVAADVIHNGKFLLKKGTVVTGRVHRFERQGPDAYMVSLRFPWNAQLQSVDREKRVVRDVGGIGSYANRTPTVDRVSEPLSEWERTEATFAHSQSRLSKGFAMTWVTQ